MLETSHLLTHLYPYNWNRYKYGLVTAVKLSLQKWLKSLSIFHARYRYVTLVLQVSFTHNHYSPYTIPPTHPFHCILIFNFVEFFSSLVSLLWDWRCPNVITLLLNWNIYEIKRNSSKRYFLSIISGISPYSHLDFSVINTGFSDNVHNGMGEVYITLSLKFVHVALRDRYSTMLYW